MGKTRPTSCGSPPHTLPPPLSGAARWLQLQSPCSGTPSSCPAGASVSLVPSLPTLLPHYSPLRGGQQAITQPSLEAKGRPGQKPGGRVMAAAGPHRVGGR